MERETAAAAAMAATLLLGAAGRPRFHDGAPHPSSFLPRLPPFPSLSSRPSFPSLFCLPSHRPSLPLPPSSHVSLDQARLALSTALLEVGISEQDANHIASNAPLTVRSLFDAALELDELAAWTSEQPATYSDLQKRVLELSLADRRRQCAALMESIGIGKQHISHVSHVLCSQDLNNLLQKIRFLEDVFPDENDDGVVIRARRMMREISISPDDSLQKTLSFFEKMEARPGGISMLSNPRKAIPYIIEEYPQLLCRDLTSNLKHLLDHLEEIGVPENKISSTIMCYPSLLLYNSIEEIQSRLRTLKKQAGVKTKDYGAMVAKYPWLLSRSVEDNVKMVVDFLKTMKVSPQNIGRSITKCPNLLGSSTRALQLMSQQMTSTGLKQRKIGYIISRSPQLLLKTPRAFLEIVDFLEALGLDENDIPKILATSPSLFASTVTHLKTKITFFHQIGIRDQRLKLLLHKYPKVLTMSVQGSLKPRLWFLQSMGLSNRDIAFMICGFPPLLGYSIQHVLRPKFDVLKNILCQPVKEVIVYPRYFSYCIRKKIIPRSRILRRSNVHLGLKDMLSKNDDEFAEEHLGFGRMLVPPM